MATDDLEEAAEVQRIAAALRTAIRLSGVSNRQIERSLHLSTGYLTRILNGEVDLRFRVVLSICEVIGLPPGNFFGALFPPVPPATKSEARLARGLGALHPERKPVAHARDPETLLRELRGFLGELKEVLEKEESRGPKAGCDFFEK